MTSHDYTEEKVYPQRRFQLAPGATHVYLIRHGESAPLRAGETHALVGGHGDPALAPNGVLQAGLVAERLAKLPISAIYVSNLQRTSQTAAPLADALGLTPIVEPDLREIFLGEWEAGIYRVKLAENDPIWQRIHVEKTWDLIPGSEKFADVQKRTRAVINRIAAEHPGKRIAVYVHGGVIGTLAATATGGRMYSFAESDNGSISHLVVNGDDWLLRRFNDTHHLGADLDFNPEEEQ